MTDTTNGAERTPYSNIQTNTPDTKGSEHAEQAAQARSKLYAGTEKFTMKSIVCCKCWHVGRKLQCRKCGHHICLGCKEVN